MFDFLNGPYVVPSVTFDLIIIKSGQIIHIHIKALYVEFHRGNKIFKLKEPYLGPKGN